MEWANENPEDRRTHAIGQMLANGYGLYDMSGNVREWVQDFYSDRYYHNSPIDDPQGANSGQYRVIRGGGWFSHARGLRSANRYGYSPDTHFSNLGARLVRMP